MRLFARSKAESANNAGLAAEAANKTAINVLLILMLFLPY
jgi:hypothetical protein